MILSIANKILPLFQIPKTDYRVELVSEGLINQSFVASSLTTSGDKFFLQQIDHNIFKDIEGLMNNINIVSNHFLNLPAPPNYLKTISAESGKNYYKSNAGDYWRLYKYVDGKTYNIAKNDKMAAEAGKMFGNFLGALISLDTSLLSTTIPRFHDIDLRYEQFHESLLTAHEKRKEKAKNLIALVEESIENAKDTYHSIINFCPQRATHNDTKLSNLLFDEKEKGICVVDYDTLMPGYIPLDFADSIRTLCSATVEDDPDTTKINFNLSLFEAFTHAFIGELYDEITKPEIENLGASIPYMPFLMGLRMLTDYLNNDIYYSTDYEHHNYDRASNQFALYKIDVGQLSILNNIVNEIVSTYKHY